MILAGDIGGTKTNLAIYDERGGALRLAGSQSFPSRNFSSLLEVIAQFRKDQPVAVTHAAFGIAGPVVEGRCTVTNLPWVVDAKEIAALLHLPSVGLINDLEAMAYGTLRLSAEDTAVLQQGNSIPHGAIAVIAAGTGLGEGALVWDGRRYRALPSEGGHADFAPRNDEEMNILRFLLKRHTRVSYERLVAGPGMTNLYDYFRAMSGTEEPSWLRDAKAASDPSAAISGAGLEKKDAACVSALETFVKVYGAETGNLALRFLATGGVFVGGGIAPKILPALQGPAFLDAFLNKGRQSPLLRNIPVRVILNTAAPLLGTAHFALVMND